MNAELKKKIQELRNFQNHRSLFDSKQQLYEMLEKSIEIIDELETECRIKDAALERLSEKYNDIGM